MIPKPAVRTKTQQQKSVLHMETQTLHKGSLGHSLMHVFILCVHIHPFRRVMAHVSSGKSFYATQCRLDLFRPVYWNVDITSKSHSRFRSQSENVQLKTIPSAADVMLQHSHTHRLQEMKILAVAQKAILVH